MVNRAATVAAKRVVASNVRTGGLLNVEKKFYDTGIAFTNLVANTDCTGAEFDPGTVNTVSAPAQGDGASNRDGKKIVCKSLELNGTVTFGSQTNQTVPDINPCVYVAVVLDTQSNGAQLNSEDVYTNPSTDASGLSGVLRNLSFGSRFRVLKSRVFDFPPSPLSWDGTNLEQQGSAKTFRWHIPLKDLVINFTSGSTAAGISAVQDNSIHVIAFSTIATSQLCYNSRLRFVG